ncbi:MAG: energy transducer TonB [Stellaceae bacterium]
MSGVRLPFALSLAGHAVLLAALALLVVTPPRPAPPVLRSIELILAPPMPKPPPAPVARPAPPKPPAIHPPPRPAPPPRPKPETAPAPVRAPLPRIAAPPPRPQHKPIFQRPERLPPRRIRREPLRPRTIPPPRYVPPPPQYYAPPPRYVPPPRRAPPAAATISPGYRARLIGWIGAHTYYPQSARDAGEEGEVLLRFRIERSGRVADVAVVRSSGYPDLDAAALAMMRGAALPPFPPSMPQQSITVEVPIRFSLG